MKIVNKTTSNNKGFTLIELLIVVSIVALLSSVVVAALTEARSGARNNRRNEMARQYINVLEFYFSEKGDFPEGGCTSCDPATRVCLGDGYPGKSCYVYGSHSESDQVNSELSEFAPAMPALLDKAGIYFGAAYGCTDANCTGYKLTWILEGNEKCAGGSEQVSFGDTLSYCTFTSSPGSSN